MSRLKQARRARGLRGAAQAMHAGAWLNLGLGIYGPLWFVVAAIAGFLLSMGASEWAARIEDRLAGDRP